MGETTAGTDASRLRSVFISYSRRDEPRVKGLEGLLRALGLDVFRDERSILPGQKWERVLEQSLASTEALVVVWSRNAATSDWVRREYEASARREIPIIPVPIDPTPLPGPLAENQTANFLPLINELLQLQSTLREQGASGAEVRERIRKRLREEGIDVDERKLNGILVFIGGASAGFLPRLLARSASRLTEGSVTMSGWGLALAGAVVAGAVALLAGNYHHQVAVAQQDSAGLRAKAVAQNGTIVRLEQAKNDAEASAGAASAAKAQCQEGLTQCENRRPGGRPGTLCKPPPVCPKVTCPIGPGKETVPPAPPPADTAHKIPDATPQASDPTMALIDCDCRHSTNPDLCLNMERALRAEQQKTGKISGYCQPAGPNATLKAPDPSAPIRRTTRQGGALTPAGGPILH